MTGLRYEVQVTLTPFYKSSNTINVLKNPVISSSDKISLKDINLSREFPRINWMLNSSKFEGPSSFKNRSLHILKKAISFSAVNSFEHLIGIKKFNKKFYTPVKQHLLNNQEEILKRVELESFYKSNQDSPFFETRVFIEACFSYMEIQYNKNNYLDFKKQLEAQTPKEGTPCVFICNHPIGIIDTLITAKLMATVRPDIKFMANSIVSKFCPEAKELLLELEILNSKSKAQKNTSTVDNAITHLKKGGMIIMFPDPILPVRKTWHKKSQQAYQELDFKKGLGQLLLSVPSTSVLSGALSGNHPNSNYFHFLGRIHPFLKISTLLREFTNTKGNSEYKVALCPLITSKEISTLLFKEETKMAPQLEEMSPLEKSKYLAEFIVKSIEKKYKLCFDHLMP